MERENKSVNLNTSELRYVDQKRHESLDEREKEPISPGNFCFLNASNVALITFIGFLDRVTLAARSVIPAHRHISKIYC